MWQVISQENLEMKLQVKQPVNMQKILQKIWSMINSKIKKSTNKIKKYKMKIKNRKKLKKRKDLDSPKKDQETFLNKDLEIQQKISPGIQREKLLKIWQKKLLENLRNKQSITLIQINHQTLQVIHIPQVHPSMKMLHIVKLLYQLRILKKVLGLILEPKGQAM